MLPKSHYLKLRARHRPSRVTVAFVLESPPISGRYFYDPSGRVTEPLFSAMMKLIGCEPSTKEAGLKAFANKGFFLVNASYKPVNHIKSGKKRNQVILSALPDLTKDLKSVTGSGQESVKIVLVKTNICRLLEKPLKDRGMNVINNGRVVPFPSHGNQNRFQEKLLNLWEESEIG